MPCHSYSTEFLIRELSESRIMLPQAQQLLCPPGGKKKSLGGIDRTYILLVLCCLTWSNKSPQLFLKRGHLFRVLHLAVLSDKHWSVNRQVSNLSGHLCCMKDSNCFCCGPRSGVTLKGFQTHSHICRGQQVTRHRGMTHN